MLPLGCTLKIMEPLSQAIHLISAPLLLSATRYEYFEGYIICAFLSPSSDYTFLSFDYNFHPNVVFAGWTNRLLI